MDIKSLLPYAAAIGGGYLANWRYGKKVPKYIAWGGGLTAGYLVGKLVSRLLMPPVPTVAALAPTVTASQGQGEYVDMFGPPQGERPVALLPQPQGAISPHTAYPDQAPSRAAFTPARGGVRPIPPGPLPDMPGVEVAGEGVFADSGMGSYDAGYGAAIDEVEAELEGMGHLGPNGRGRRN